MVAMRLLERNSSTVAARLLGRSVHAPLPDENRSRDRGEIPAGRPEAASPSVLHNGKTETALDTQQEIWSRRGAFRSPKSPEAARLLA